MALLSGVLLWLLKKNPKNPLVISPLITAQKDIWSVFPLPVGQGRIHQIVQVLYVVMVMIMIITVVL